MAATTFRMERYGSRFWAIYDGDALVCVTVYKRGAVEVIRRLGADRDPVDPKCKDICLRRRL